MYQNYFRGLQNISDIKLIYFGIIGRGYMGAEGKRMGLKLILLNIHLKYVVVAECRT